MRLRLSGQDLVEVLCVIPKRKFMYLWSLRLSQIDVVKFWCSLSPGERSFKNYLELRNLWVSEYLLERLKNTVGEKPPVKSRIRFDIAKENRSENSRIIQLEK